MKKVAITYLLAMLIINTTYATNGDNMIGFGPTSGAMGGVGIAKAQDSISSIFANPATLTQLNGDEFDFAGTFFDPTLKANVVSPNPTNGVGNWKAESQDEGFLIPAIGLTHKINENYVFGIGAYGFSGMGVDYRNQDPMATNTKISVMKFVPALAYKNGNFSYGLGIDIDYQAADFGAGLSHDYAIGERLGVNYEYGKWNFGLIYVTSQLENPAQYGFGISHKCTDKLTSAIEIKYLD
jgi:long-chain fatty acid transport protein